LLKLPDPGSQSDDSAGTARRGIKNGISPKPVLFLGRFRVMVPRNRFAESLRILWVIRLELFVFVLKLNCHSVPADSDSSVNQIGREGMVAAIVPDAGAIDSQRA